MGGSILQIAAEGEQDKYLTSCPDITFFKAVYHRHTRFAMETFELDSVTRCVFGNKINIPINKLGDLLTDLTLRIQLPGWEQPEVFDDADEITKVSWANSIGHVLIDYVELSIDNVVIDKLHGEWLDIWSNLTVDGDKLDAHRKMIGYMPVFDYDLTGSQELWVRLPFWFSHNIAQALPLIAMTSVDVSLHVYTRPIEQCWCSNNPKHQHPVIEKSQSGESDMRITLLADYVMLAGSERATTARTEHTFLIEQTQRVTRESLPSSTTLVYLDMTFRHCVKELVWIVQRTSLTSHRQSSGGRPRNDWCNYEMVGEHEGESPIKTCRININGQDRVSLFPATFFRMIQPFRHHSRVPDKHIFCYSFAVKPEDIQPTGTLNFSKIENPQLILELNNSDHGGDETSNLAVRCYARNYNVMKIKGGRCATLFQF